MHLQSQSDSKHEAANAYEASKCYKKLNPNDMGLCSVFRTRTN
ncbi:unnamed protein product [Brassica oleracea var. botrytis]